MLKLTLTKKNKCDEKKKKKKSHKRNGGIVYLYSAIDAKLTTIAPAASPRLDVHRAGAAASISRLTNSPSPLTSCAVSFRKRCVGNISGLAEIWNNGAYGIPSNWNRCSLKPSLISLYMRQMGMTSV